MKIKFINLKFKCGKIKCLKAKDFRNKLKSNKLTIEKNLVGPEWTETLFINIKERYEYYNEM